MTKTSHKKCFLCGAKVDSIYGIYWNRIFLCGDCAILPHGELKKRIQAKLFQDKEEEEGEMKIDKISYD